MAKQRVVRTPLALTVLNLLDERPMHPYEMQQLIRERGIDHSVKLKGGSIYDSVERLVAAGLAAPRQTSREGRRPERTVYAITAAGRDEFRAWLREMLSRPAQEYPQLGAALAFLGHLKPEEAEQLLQQRAAVLAADIAATESMLQSLTRMGIPRLYGIEGEYGRDMRRAELAWVEALMDQIRDGRLEWPVVIEWPPARESEGPGEINHDGIHAEFRAGDSGS